MAIPGRDEREPCYRLCGCCTFLGCLLTVILVPLSYSKLEYFQHGIVQQKSTSKVNRDTVYGSGSHPIGPDYQFKVFETNALFFTDSVDEAFDYLEEGLRPLGARVLETVPGAASNKSL